MKKILILIIVSLFCTACTNHAEKSEVLYSVIDSQGQEVAFSKKPTKILTLALETDIITLGLVPADNLVAVNSLLTDPSVSNVAELAATVPHTITNPTAEEILKLSPDLVIISDWGNTEQREILQNLGINVLVVNGAKSLSDIEANISLIAAALDEKEKGENLLAQMDAKLAELEGKLAKLDRPKPRIALISVMNGYGSRGTLFDDLCQKAHVINTLDEIEITFGTKLTKEMLITLNPDILFLPSYNNAAFDREAFIASYTDDKALSAITAIKNKELKFPRDAYIYNGSQDAVFGAWEIAAMCYGDEFLLPDGEHLSAVGLE